MKRKKKGKDIYMSPFLYRIQNGHILQWKLPCPCLSLSYTSELFHIFWIIQNAKPQSKLSSVSGGGFAPWISQKKNEEKTIEVHKKCKMHLQDFVQRNLTICVMHKKDKNINLVFSCVIALRT
jgi:hypothetical protein